MGIAPQLYARAAGALELTIVACGIFAEGVVRGSLVVAGNAAETAGRIVGSEHLFRLAYAGELVMLTCDVAVAWIYYVLLRPVNERLALLAAFFRLTMAATLGANALNHHKAILLLGGADYLTAFEPEQLRALALFSLRSHGFGHDVGLVFFGVHCLVLGFLIVRSGYLPRALGVGAAVAGLGYLTHSFVRILAPGLATSLLPGILVPALLAALFLSLWLLFAGVNEHVWRARAGGASRGES